jgi:hypothetical protein
MGQHMRNMQAPTISPRDTQLGVNNPPVHVCLQPALAGCTLQRCAPNVTGCWPGSMHTPAYFPLALPLPM